MDLRDDRSEKVNYDSKYLTYIRRGCLSGYPNYAAPSHWHDDIEFILVLSGEMQYNINGEIITLKSDEGLFVNARQMHCGFSSMHSECDFICILLHPSLLCAHPDTEQDFIRPIVRNQKFPYALLSAKVLWQREICYRLKQIYDIKNSPTMAMKVLGHFALIWSLLLENAPEYFETEPVQDRDLAVLKNMVGLIQQHYTEKITLPQVAKAGCMGESKCCKLFQRYLKQTPNKYLTEYRLNKSIGLLQNSEMTITQIALSVGFGGGSYYAEIFRKWMGLTPVEYRKSKASLRS